MQRFFVTAPGTGIGKTLVTAALAWQLHEAGKKVTVLKPVISGYDPADAQSDTALLLKSCGIGRTKEAADAISPWRFAAPLSPDMAAAQEEKPPVDLDKLIEFCQRAKGDYVLAEGVGGVMSPVNNHHTVLDWITTLSWPVILVTGSYLGAIGHALMSLDVLQGRNVPVKALVVSESESGVAVDDTVATLEKFLLKPIPVVKIPRIAATSDSWKHVPSIIGICA